MVADDSVSAGDRVKTIPRYIRYSERFEELAGWYMSIGMSYHDYWDGDADMPKYFRDKYKAENDIINYRLWILGSYIYEAILDASPALNPLMKDHTPVPYRANPFPLDDKEKQRLEKLEEKNKFNKAVSSMKGWAKSVNDKRLEVQNGG